MDVTHIKAFEDGGTVYLGVSDVNGGGGNGTVNTYRSTNGFNSVHQTFTGEIMVIDLESLSLSIKMVLQVILRLQLQLLVVIISDLVLVGYTCTMLIQVELLLMAR